MKRLIIALVAMVTLGGCSAGYSATKTSDETPNSVPKCFVIDRYDDGVKDGLGKHTLGTYCKEEK